MLANYVSCDVITTKIEKTKHKKPLFIFTVKWTTVLLSITMYNTEDISMK